jgi:hypothetical protein
MELKFNPLEAPIIAGSLHLLTDAGIPSIKIYNLKYLVTPKAMRYFSHFKQFVLKNQDTPADQDFLTIEDFKTFEIVRARETQLGVKTTNSGELITLETTAYRYGTGYLLGRWREHEGNLLVKSYNSLKDLLPIPMAEVSKRQFEDDLYKPSFTVLTSSTAILTFLYFLYTFNVLKTNRKYMIIIVAIEGNTADAIDRIDKLANKLKELGDDFPTILDNLRFASHLL